MKLYAYTYTCFASDVMNFDPAKGKLPLGVFFATEPPPAVDATKDDRVLLGHIDIPDDELRHLLPSRGEFAQRAAKIIEAKINGKRVECEVECAKLEQQRQQFLAIENGAEVSA